jgi:hypothetical protein
MVRVDDGGATWACSAVHWVEEQFWSVITVVDERLQGQLRCVVAGGNKVAGKRDYAVVAISRIPWLILECMAGAATA